jgi:rare lipoprotein A
MLRTMGGAVHFRPGWLMVLILACTSCGLASTPPAQSPAAQSLAEPPASAAQQEAQHLAQLPPVVPGRYLDRSGRIEKGRASYYAHYFDHRKMADGHRFNPNSNVAASKTLPIGTTAKVTNVRNGRSALVKVEDRGPHVPGRVVDLTPKVADQLGMKKVGVTPVEVAPVAVPEPGGGVKLGAGAAGASSQEVQSAVETAQTASH